MELLSTVSLVLLMASYSAIVLYCDYQTSVILTELTNEFSEL